MKDQHKHIKGYRDLTEAEVSAMNAVKDEGVRLGLLIEEMKDNTDLDQRWVSMAEDSLQKGLMFAVRAIAKPTTF